MAMANGVGKTSLAASFSASAFLCFPPVGSKCPLPGTKTVGFSVLRLISAARRAPYGPRIHLRPGARAAIGGPELRRHR
jgi:hypothetical protein